MKKVALLVGLFLFIGISVPLVQGFLDEITELRQELVTWQTTHAADFSDLINTIDDISGVQFGDVEEGDWYNPYVQSVASWGLFLDIVGQMESQQVLLDQRIM